MARTIIVFEDAPDGKTFRSSIEHDPPLTPVPDTEDQYTGSPAQIAAHLMYQTLVENDGTATPEEQDASGGE